MTSKIIVGVMSGDHRVLLVCYKHTGEVVGVTKLCALFKGDLTMRQLAGKCSVIRSIGACVCVCVWCNEY